MGAKDIERNSWEVLKFLEVWHKLEASTQVSEQPFDRKAKGSWRPPCSDAALSVMDANAEVSTILSPILDELMRTKASHAGIRASTLLTEVRDKPGLLPAIRAEEGKEWRALKAFCYLIAQAISVKMDGPDGPYRVKVALTKGEIEDALRDPRQDPPGKARTYTAHYSYRIIDAWRERLVAEGFSDEAAVGYLMDHGVGKDRITSARRFVEAERDSAA